jgi:tRNA nucleotidyltransferase (CCA-adding enzyme)
LNEKEIAMKLNSHYSRATIYRVGGSERDRIISEVHTLNLSSKDRDYCVTGVTEQEFTTVFPEAKIVGKGFPVFLLEVDGEAEEFALARKERKKGEGHTEFEIETDISLTIKDDLLRRDLTMNAVAVNILTNEVVDPFGGVEDIKNKIIRAVSQAFAEDPLRVYRAARFASQKSFLIEEKTIEMMTSLKGELKTLTIERVFEELKKSLDSQTPSLFFRTLKSANVLDVHFPHIHRLIGVAQPKKNHPEGDVFEHTMNVLDAMAQLTIETENRFAALVHDLGKGLSPLKWEKDPNKFPYETHRGHEKAGLPLVKEMCEELKLPKRWLRAGMYGTEHHGKMRSIRDMKSIKIVDVLEGASKNPIGVEGFVKLALADKRGKGNQYDVYEHYDFCMKAANEIKKVRANPDLPVKKIAEDKKKRQAKEVQKIKLEL